jgi:hypothetical protein
MAPSKLNSKEFFMASPALQTMCVYGYQVVQQPQLAALAGQIPVYIIDFFQYVTPPESCQVELTPEQVRLQGRAPIDTVLEVCQRTFQRQFQQVVISAAQSLLRLSQTGAFYLIPAKMSQSVNWTRERLQGVTQAVMTLLDRSRIAENPVEALGVSQSDQDGNLVTLAVRSEQPPVFPPEVHQWKMVLKGPLD